MHHGERSFNKHLSVVTYGQKANCGAFWANFNPNTGAFAAFRLEPVSLGVFLKLKSAFWSSNQYIWRMARDILETRVTTTNCDNVPTLSEACWHIKGFQYLNHFMHRRQEEYDSLIILYPFLVQFKHTDDSDIDRQPTVEQQISSFPNCVEILPVGSDCRLPPLFIITISTDAQVYLLSINEPQFAAELEERQAHLKSSQHLKSLAGPHLQSMWGYFQHNKFSL